MATITDKIAASINAATGLPFYYDTPETLNTRMDNAQFPCVLLPTITQSEVVEENGIMRERVTASVMFTNNTELDFDGMDNERILDALKHDAFKWLLSLTHSTELRIVRNGGTQRLYATDDAVLTSFVVNLTFEECEGVSEACGRVADPFQELYEKYMRLLAEAEELKAKAEELKLTALVEELQHRIAEVETCIEVLLNCSGSFDNIDARLADFDASQKEQDARIEEIKTKLDAVEDVAWQAKRKADANATDIANLNGKVNLQVENLKSSIAEVSGHADAANAAIDMLTGDGDGSIKKAVADGVAKVVAEAPADFDTLKEVADWIQNDATGAAAMQNAITELKNGKADKTELANVKSTAEAASAKADANATAISNEATRAKAAEKANADAVATKAEKTALAATDANVAALSTNKADKTALSTLEGKVNTKADASALATTNGNVTALQNGKADKSSLATTDAKIAELAAKHITDYNELRDAIADIAQDGYLPESYKETHAYGVERDVNVSSKDLVRIGNPSLHRTCPLQNGIKGYCVDDYGNKTYTLPYESWVGEPTDGSMGQVMCEIPTTYIRIEKEGTKRRIWLSQYPIKGFRKVNPYFEGAYIASMDREQQKLCSIANTAPRYRGGNNNASYDNTDHSLLGKPATAISRTNFRKYARNRNGGATEEWNELLTSRYQLLCCYFMVEYATTDTQKAFTDELTPEGYKQGGLSAGATNYDWNKWTAFNGNNPIIPCGYTDALGNRTGVMEFITPESYGVAGHKCYVSRYHGLELFFNKDVWFWADGTNIKVQSDADGGKSMVYELPFDTMPTNAIDSGYDGMVYLGDESRTQNYVRDIIGGDTFCIVPTEVGNGASSNAFFCDYHYTNIPTSGTSLRGVLLGGRANDGAAAGAFCVYSNYGPSATGANVGSRLCFIPRTNETAA